MTNVAKNTLSFSCSKIMKYLRTPIDIWKELSNEFEFTCDMCASDENHLLDKYYTINNSALDKDWNNEIGYVHPLFDSKIGKFVKKAYESKGTFVYYQHLLILNIFTNGFIITLMLRLDF